MIKRLICIVVTATIVLLSLLLYARSGLLFKINQSGAATSADVVLCLNGNRALSCQKYRVTKQNLAIGTTIKRPYPAVGIKIVTKGYKPAGCKINPKTGYCLFATQGGRLTPIAVKQILPTRYTVGGTTSGLVGSVQLQNNGKERLTQNASGRFTFPTPLVKGASYNVTVSSQPPTQTCIVTRGSGVISSSNITNIQVTCTKNTYKYTVGGTISGLVGEVQIQNNDSDTLNQTIDGRFTFATSLTEDSPYDVTISSQPATQTCSVNNGSGVIGSSNVTNVQITCSTNNYTVGGSVHGLVGTLILENNNGDDLTMSADGPFVFSSALPAGSTYTVSVQNQPSTQTCTVNNGTGTITNANVTDITVSCSTNTRTIGGVVSGLTPSESVVLQNNSDDNLTLNANGSFVFTTPIAEGATYDVTVLTQPNTQTCTATQNSGTVGASNINNVQITCSTNAYNVGGSVSDLEGTVVLQNNGADDLLVSDDGPFTFSTPVAQGAPYAVTVLSSPVEQVCQVTANGNGVMGGSNINDVEVSCMKKTTLTSNALNDSLALSVTGRTEYGVSGTPSSGASRTITISNTGDLDAVDFQVDYTGLPSTTTHTGTCDGLTTLSQGASCTIQINPGADASSNNSGTYVSCNKGTSPVPGTVMVSATNADSKSTSVVVLDYGCIYQGGYVFALDDTQGCSGGTCSGSIGGKVMSTVDQAAVSPNGVVWSSRGTIGNGSGGLAPLDVSNDTIPGISHTSTTASSNPTYAAFASFFSTTYDNTNPFSASSFMACKGNSDGQCNTENIVVFYNQFITNYVNPGPGPFTASPGPTPLTYYAAGLCKQTIATYSDWYLPAICELGYGSATSCGSSVTPTVQNIQLSLINTAALPAAPAGVYWSSTERSDSPQTHVWTQTISSSGPRQDYYTKQGLRGVRCIRGLSY